MIEVTNLTKRYGKHEAVRNLTFRVEKGQVYGFLGPNGAGKSTTMNIITGYLCASEGTVTVNGCDIFKEPEKAKSYIGYLPELPPLYQDMTVLEYLKFVAELKKVKKSERTSMIADVMEMTGIQDVSGRIIRNLSKGYRQRVGLAQAIIGYPEVIILDEPTVGLDPKQIIEIRDLIKRLKENHTIILSSHILSEVSAVCDQIMIMSKGQLVANDTPQNLSDRLSGNQTILLIVKGVKAQIEHTLEAICKDVDSDFSFSITEETKDHQHIIISFTDQDSEKLREKLFYAFAADHLPILEMSSEQASLEEVFLELTSTVNDSSEEDETAEGIETLKESETTEKTETLKKSETIEKTEVNIENKKEESENAGDM
ncbi:MAG: ABC transporter ATP-binding protein [Clostridia bacterium]|nr:ABC transporter ATP-binding protein [Clostridia bacterium]